MKLFIYILALLLFTTSLTAETLRLSEPVQTDTTSETFGAPVDEFPPLDNIANLLNHPDLYQGRSIAVTATVKKVCKKKGCFFIAQQNEHVIRVAFKDYSFFVPTNIDNRNVTLLGELTKRVITEKEAEHFSADLGVTNSVQSGHLYEIIASSVRVDLPQTDNPS